MKKTNQACIHCCKETIPEQDIDLKIQDLPPVFSKIEWGYSTPTFMKKKA
ncbi:Uncharacterised protein [Legionella taurinensis]|nr:Uncharacterised protein [Legionella taurinensis]